MADKPIDKPEAETKPKKSDKLVVRLLADYWDADGTRHTASYIDENGEYRATGAMIELPTEEARKLVKTNAAERGDEY
jgi:hypothetical protein